MNRSLLFLATITHFCFLSCSSSKDLNKLNSTLEKIAVKELGDGYNCQWNEDNQFALCIIEEQPESSYSINQINYFIYNRKTKKIVRKEKLVNSEVKWDSKHLIKIISIPGMVEENNTLPSQKLLDVRTGEIVSPNEI
jgi:hypothetical protein